jgi:hypothetical protein
MIQMQSISRTEFFNSSKDMISEIEEGETKEFGKKNEGEVLLPLNGRKSQMTKLSFDNWDSNFFKTFSRRYII